MGVGGRRTCKREKQITEQNQDWAFESAKQELGRWMKFSRCLPSFHRQAHRYLGNAADAEDVVQDALISAFRHLNQFRGQAQMSTWENAIVMNCARMQLRRRRQTLQSLDEKLGDEERYSVSERLAD